MFQKDKKLARDLALVLASDMNDVLLQETLQRLKNKLPMHVDEYELTQWWHTNGEDWNHELRQVFIDRCNIGYDWQFTNEQAELLTEYYNANLLIVECMNRSDVSEQVREEIESNLLLPISSIPNTEL